MRKRKSVYLLLLLIVGFFCLEPFFPYPSNITYIAMGDKSWVPPSIDGLYVQDQTLNVKAEINCYHEGIGGISGWSIIVVTMYPDEVNVSIVFEVEYVKVQNEYVPVYLFHYDGEFLYGNPANTTIYFPLPYGTITDLYVKVNSQDVEKPTVVSNQIKINLTEENSTVSISFNSYGTKRYSHEVPKNVFVERFFFQVMLQDVDEKNINLEESLSPNDMTSSKKSVILVWDNENAIMRKDVVIDMLTRPIIKGENPGVFLTNFLFGLAIAGVLIGAFYFEGFKRLKHEKKIENSILLLLPYFLLTILLGTLIFWIGIINSLMISLIGFAIVSLLIDKKAIKISKGIWEFFLIPTFLLLVLIGLIIEEGLIGSSLTMVSSLLLIGLFASFFVRHPRQIKNGPIIFRNKKPEPPTKKGEISKDSIITDSKETKKPPINKNFCPHCGSKLGDDFSFCSKCGQDISSVVRCQNCGNLRRITDSELFCPNCGSGIKQAK